MSSSFTVSDSTSFTVTHARHMAAKVATDLKRMQRFYRAPSDRDIDRYEEEVVELLRRGFLSSVSYGFRRDGRWVEPMLQYTARDLLGGTAADDSPGKIRPGKDTTGASFYSFLTYSSAWFALSDDERAAVKAVLPFSRTGASEPGFNGYLEQDRTYSRGGRALDRRSLRTH